MISLYNIIVGLTEERFNKAMKSPIKDFTQIVNLKKSDDVNNSNSGLGSLSDLNIKPAINKSSSDKQYVGVSQNQNRFNSSQNLGFNNLQQKPSQGSSLAFNLNIKSKINAGPNKKSNSNNIIEIENESQNQDIFVSPEKKQGEMNNRNNDSVKKLDSSLSSLSSLTSSASKKSDLNKFLNNKF